MTRDLTFDEVGKVRKEVLDILHELEEREIWTRSNHPGLVAGVIAMAKMSERIDERTFKDEPK